MHLMLQLFAIVLVLVAVSSHEYGGSHGPHSGGEHYSGLSRSISGGRSLGVSQGRSNSGWGSFSGYGANARSYHSNDRSNNVLGRSNCGSDNYDFGGHDSSFRSTW